MTSPPSPPNRRRRRIVVTLAVLVVGLCWWLWPRVDQRFVGNWAVKGTQQAIEFSWDGRGQAQGPGASEDLRWRVEGDMLLLSHEPLPGLLKNPLAAIQRLIAGGVPPTPYHFQFLDQDTILLRGGNGTRRGPFDMTLHRVAK